MFYLYGYATLNVQNSELSGNEAGFAGVAYIDFSSGGTSAAVFDNCTLSDNLVAHSGGLFVGVNFGVRNSIIKDNVACAWGGVVRGSADFDNCVIVNNTASVCGGVAFISVGLMRFVNCVIDHNSAKYGSFAYNFADNAIDDATANLVIDRSSFSNTAIPAITSEEPVVIRNTQGLGSVDVVNVPVQGCADPEIKVNYCSEVPATCSDVSSEDGNVPLGFSCYCEPDGVLTDPLDASCASSASISDPVAGVMITTEDVWVRVTKPDTGRVDLQFSNLGDVSMRWGLFLTSNPSQAVWNTPNQSGSLDGGQPMSLPLQVNSEGLQARDAAYVTRFTLNTSSPERTPKPESKSTQFMVHTVVSAPPNVTASYVDITDAAGLVARGILEFEVTSIDVTGMVILDAADVAYTAVLVHSSSSTSVACRVVYEVDAIRHKGLCEAQGLEAGSFELNVYVGSDMVGGGGYHLTVDGCPDSYELSDDGLSCTCPAGRYELGNTCAACADGTHKPKPGVKEAACVACQTGEDSKKGLTSNANLTACDACEDGYFRIAGLCRDCPTGAACTMNSDVATMAILPGHWRTSAESHDVHECRFGDLSCPGESNNQASGPDRYCAPEYVGALCSECHDDFFKSWDGAGACQACAAGKSHWPTIGLVGTTLVIGALFVGAINKCRKKKPEDEDAPPSSGMFANAEKLFVLAKVKIFTLFLTAQVVSQFATISSGTGDSSYPEPAATLVRALGMTNLDILGFGAF